MCEQWTAHQLLVTTYPHFNPHILYIICYETFSVRDVHLFFHFFTF